MSIFLFFLAAPGVEEFLDRDLKLRPEFMQSAEKTLSEIGDKFQSVLKFRYTKRGRKYRRKKLTFVGVHSRRTDYLPYMEQHGMDEVPPQYFFQAMDIYRYTGF